MVDKSNKLFHWVLGILMLAGSLYFMIQVRDRSPHGGLLGLFQKEHQQVVLKAKYETLNHNIPSFAELWFLIQNPGERPNDDLKEYISYYQMVHTLFPHQYPETYALLGFCFYYNGQFKKARLAYQKFYQLNPDFFWAPYNLAILALKERKFPLAARYFTEAIEKSPKDTFEFIARSHIYGQILQSRNLNYSLGDSYKNSYANALFGLGLSLKVLGQTQKASRAFTQLKQIDPEFSAQNKEIFLKIF